jgi:hypothetical protein
MSSDLCSTKSCALSSHPHFLPSPPSSLFAVKMSSRQNRRSALILILVSFLTSHVLAQCNTNQNPHCAGNSKFEQLCCPYPAVCYYANRYGGVACCQPGQQCYGDGITIAPTLILASTPAPAQTVQSTQMIQPTQNGGYSTITVTGGIPAATVGTAIGYTTTAGVIVANDASRAIGNTYTTQFSLGLTLLAWILT